MKALVVALLLLAFTLIVYLVLLTIRRRYTKERFAFLAYTSLSTLSFLVVVSILARGTPFQIILQWIAEARGKSYSLNSPNAIELVVICFLAMLLYNIAHKIFQNWEGPISVEDRRRELQQERTGFLLAAIREGIRLLTRRPPSPLYEPSAETRPSLNIESPEDTLAWREQARELICLRDPTFEFSEQHGWHEQESCWVGKNLRTEEVVFLGCSVDKPTPKRLRLFAHYVKRIGSNGTRLASSHFWFFRKGSDDQRIEIDGVAIACEAESTVLNQLVDFSDYYFDITRRVEQETLPESDITLSDVYVQSLCGETASLDDNNTHPVEDVLRMWLSEPSCQHIALLGEYGQGKSTCALMFARNLLRERAEAGGRVPVVIELRGKAPSALTPEELLATWAVRYRINPIALKKLVIAGRVLLIFDGFDEMAFIGQGDARIEHFRTIWHLAYPKAKILITGRPNFFLDELEMRAALGIRQEVPGSERCRAVYLKPFSYEQIGEALRAFNNTVRSEIQGLAESNSRFRDLASRPCLLYIIGVLWEKRHEAISQNLNSASVIDLFVRYSLERQAAKARAGGRFMILSTPERMFFMKGVAAHMITNRLPNQISIRDLRAVTSHLLEIIPDTVTTREDAMVAKPHKPLRERISDDENLVEALQTDVRTYGLLVNDPSNATTMRFAHKSFMEYLAAKVAADASGTQPDDPSAAIKNSFNLSIAIVMSAPETMAFFCESIASKLDLPKDDVDLLAKPLLHIFCKRPVKCVGAWGRRRWSGRDAGFPSVGE